MKIKQLLLLFLLIPFLGFGQIFEENFDDYLGLETRGWVNINLSEPTGSLGWFQGNPEAFPAHSGATNSYIAANHQSTSASGGQISVWLITPEIEVKDGDVLSFYTRVPDGSIWNDRLEVRTSIGELTLPAGSAEDVGSFTQLELVINDDYDLSYPEEWTQYEVEVSGVGSDPTTVHFAFRYNVDNSDGLESNFIGIDDVVVSEDGDNGSDDEGCEWTVKVWSYETFAEDISWELRSGDDVLLVGGPYDFMVDETQTIVAEGPVEFYISTQGPAGDNEAYFKVSNENGILVDGYIGPDEEATYSDLNCSDEGEEDNEVYCIPHLDCELDDMITHVIFQEIDNESTCSEDGYGDYTDQTATVEAGQSYEITVGVGAGWDYESVSVWIDFNQNQVFDEDEFTYIGTGSDELLTGTIEIPEGVEPGEYRMRVRVASVGEDDATADMACDTIEQFFGETEDYTVVVVEDGNGDDFPAPYCAVEGLEFGVEPITRVVFADIDNSSPADSDIPHENFTDIVGTVETNGSYVIKLEGNTFGMYQNSFTVFIDWNQDNEFDIETERYEIGTLGSSDGTDGQQVVGSIEIPADAVLGDTRMRIIKSYGSFDFAPDGCTDISGFGQVEDYTLHILEGDNGPVYCEPYLECSDGDVITRVVLADIDNESGCSENGYSDYTDQIAYLTQGETYEISVTVGDGWEDESVSIWIDYDNSYTFDEDEFTYLGTGSGETITGTITIPEDAAIGVFRMRVRVAAVDGPDATADMACDSETQFYGETEDYSVSIGEMGVDSYESLNLSFYPNPVQNTLHITADQNLETAVVYNLLGQQVKQFTHLTDGKLDFDNLNSGLYLVKLNFDNGASHTIKVVKE